MSVAASINLPVIGDGRSILTHSRMQCGKTCHRKEWFRYEVGLRPDKTAQPLRIGKAVHLGIELWTTGTANDDAIAQATNEYEILPAWANHDEAREDWMVEAETVRRLLSGYFWRWGQDNIEIVSSEQTFVLPIRNPETGHTTPTFLVGGKWDGIGRLPDTRLAVIEHKTVGQDISPESDYWKRLRMDQQISLYMMAARRSGFDVSTVLYDAIRKPSIRPRKLTKAEQASMASTQTWFGEKIALNGVVPERESAVMFGARLNADIAERPDYYFARVEVPRLESDLTEFETELWEMQLDIRTRQKTGRWYRNTAACVGFGRCEFIDLCANTWNPSDRTPAGFRMAECVHEELLNGDTDNDTSPN